MPRASKKQIDREVDKEIKDNLYAMISLLHTSDEIAIFFQDFLSVEEQIMLGKRLMVYVMLRHNYQSKEIADVLGMSIETIRTHRNKRPANVVIFNKVISAVVKQSKTREFLKKIDTFLRPIEVILQAKSNSKARAKLWQGDFNN